MCLTIAYSDSSDCEEFLSVAKIGVWFLHMRWVVESR